MREAHAGVMRRVAYAGGTFVTSDRIAQAMLEYAAALANADRAATLHVPAVGDDGETHDVQVLVGPSSQLMADEIEHAGPEPDGDAFVTSIEGRMATLHRTFVPADDESMLDWDI